MFISCVEWMPQKKGIGVDTNWCSLETVRVSTGLHPYVAFRVACRLCRFWGWG